MYENKIQYLKQIPNNEDEIFEPKILQSAYEYTTCEGTETKENIRENQVRSWLYSSDTLISVTS